ncbi:hypothetical protein LTR37_001385 [Vermiconidia calcicola]|uniref:Uncharacterized protein n=1 Tax=Vermiconidia calcicola TaxID=1690605 RepID=A0ACC3NX78_9PEZI|nr:hypothetical protein LTR37_001385 [Vermiconidia calcicola]
MHYMQEAKGEVRRRCWRCQTLGTGCEGYEGHASPQRPSPVTHATTGLSLRSLDGNVSSLPEKRALDFFRATTAPWIAGFLDDAVWDRTVLQMAVVIPAVRHASCALAALHEGQISRNTTANPFTTAFGDPPSLAEQQYEKAVSELRQLVGSSKPQTNAILVSAMLCIHFESLRENFVPALMHGRSAIGLLNSKGTSAADVVDDKILRAMIQLDVQGSVSMEARAPGLPFHTVMDAASMPDRFFSVTHAREVINAWTSRLISFTRTVANQHKYCDQDSTPHSVLAEATDYKRSFQKLDSLLSELTHRPNIRLTIREHEAISVLHVRTMLNAIQSATCLSREQTAFDASVSEFDEILTVCTHLLYSKGLGQKIWSASVDDGLIYPLFYTAIHCRESRIRHQALTQLKRLPGAERMWHVQSWVRVAELWIGYEEELLDTPPKVATARDVPEYRRVHMAHSKDLEALAPRHPGEVYLRTRPNGMRAEWEDVEYHLK